MMSIESSEAYNRREILNRFKRNRPKNIYGLILAETWENQEKIKNWWIDEGDMGRYESWNQKGICNNMEEWTCKSISIEFSIQEDENTNSYRFYILYGYIKF